MVPPLQAPLNMGLVIPVLALFKRENSLLLSRQRSELKNLTTPKSVAGQDVPDRKS